MRAVRVSPVRGQNVHQYLHAARLPLRTVFKGVEHQAMHPHHSADPALVQSRAFLWWDA